MFQMKCPPFAELMRLFAWHAAYVVAVARVVVAENVVLVSIGLVINVQVEVVVAVIIFSTVAITVVLSVRVLVTVAVRIVVAVFTVTFWVTVVVGSGRRHLAQVTVWVVKVKMVVLQTTDRISGQHLFSRVGLAVGANLSTSRLLRRRGR
jgi:hypothetical protein